MRAGLPSREKGLPYRILREERLLFMSSSLYCTFLALLGISTDMVFYLQARLYIIRIIRNKAILNRHCC